MTNDAQKNDLRIRKTYKALTAAMLTLLNSRNFNKITVCGLCEEALVSRSSFYTHFNDKYSLLGYLLTEMKKDFTIRLHDNTTEQMGIAINRFIDENSKIIKNLLTDANEELLTIIYTFTSPPIVYSIEENKNLMMSPNHVALSCFYAGGVVNLLLWQVKNNFPPDTQMMTGYLTNLIKGIMEWDLNQE